MKIRRHGQTQRCSRRHGLCVTAGKSVVHAILLALAILFVGPSVGRSVEHTKDPKLIWAFGDSLTAGGAVGYEISPAKGKRSATTLVNKTGYKIRVHVFNRSDAVRAVPKMNFHLSPNASRTLSAKGESYSIRIFQARFIDKLVAKDLWAAGKTTIKKSGDNAVATSDLTRFTNQTEKKIKVCVYNVGDKVQAVPRKHYFVGPGETVTYHRPRAGKFRVSAFWPDLLDKAIVTQLVEDRCRICVRPGPKSSYPAELGKLLGAEYKVKQYGKSGEVVSKAAHAYKGLGEDAKYGLQRLRDELNTEARAKRPLPGVILICQGANDRQAARTKGISATDRKSIEAGLNADLRAMVKYAQDLGVKVVLLGQPQEEAISVSGNGVGLVGAAAPIYASVGKELNVPVDTHSLPSLYVNVKRGEYLASDNRHLTARGNAQLRKVSQRSCVGKNW